MLFIIDKFFKYLFVYNFLNNLNNLILNFCFYYCIDNGIIILDTLDKFSNQRGEL